MANDAIDKTPANFAVDCLGPIKMTNDKTRGNMRSSSDIILIETVIKLNLSPKLS